MAADQIAFQINKKFVQAKSSLVVGAKFLNRSTAALVVPTNVKYRVDDLATGAPLLDWTGITAASTVSITLTPTQNAIRNSYNSLEQKQLTVASDYSLSTQYIETLIYTVKNVQGLN